MDGEVEEDAKMVDEMSDVLEGKKVVTDAEGKEVVTGEAGKPQADSRLWRIQEDGADCKCKAPTSETRNATRRTLQAGGGEGSIKPET